MESRRVRNQENGCASWLMVPGFMVMGLVPGFSLSRHSDSRSFQVVHASGSQEGCKKEGFWEMLRHAVCPSDLSRTLPVGGWLAGSESFFPGGPPVVKLTPAHGYYGAPARVRGLSQCTSLKQEHRFL